MGLVLSTPPSAEPVSILEATAHLRLDTSNAQPHPTAPTVALISPAAAGNVDNGAHRYRAAFVTASGETDGGDISASVTTVDKTVNGKVSLSAIQVGGTGVTARKLYRTVAGGSTYFLLATIADNTTTTYTDNTADAGLGAGVPSVNGTVDPELSGLISAARRAAEKYTGAGIVTQRWTLTLDRFPCNAWERIPLERGPVLAIVSVSYIDTNGAPQTLDPATYVLDQTELSATLSLVHGQQWPATQCQANAVTIITSVGYGADATTTPDDLKRAMLLLIGDYYRNREAQGAPLVENRAVCALLDGYVRKMVA